MTMLFSRSGDWISARVGDEIVMMSVEAGKYIGLNRVGARIWELMETPQSPDALTGQLVNEFEVDEATCRAEVDAFLQSLVDHQAATTTAQAD